MHTPAFRGKKSKQKQNYNQHKSLKKKDKNTCPVM